MEAAQLRRAEIRRGKTGNIPSLAVFFQLNRAMMLDMTRDRIKDVLDRVLTWPRERQEDAAEILMSIEAQDKSGYRLSDEQLAELRRRRAEKNPKTLTLAEFDERLRRFGV